MSSPYFEYMGRIDRQNPDEPLFIYAGSQVKMRFTGEEVYLKIKKHTMWGDVALGYVIDGRMGKIPLMQIKDDEETEIKLVSNLGEGEHTLIVYKRLASNYFYTLSDVRIEGGELLPCKTEYRLKLEAYGDSVTAGEVLEAVDFVGRSDPENHGSAYDNSYNSFVFQTARNLNAEINAVAQGGIAVFTGTGYFHYPDGIGMEDVYDKLGYFPEVGISDWDFSQYVPDAVILALGQNDKHNAVTDKDDIDITDPETRNKWKEGYKKIIRSLSEHYGKNTKYIFTTTLLMHDKEWDNAIAEIVSELNAEGIAAYRNIFRRNGSATPGHPRLQEHTEMAKELTDYILSLGLCR